MMVDLIVVYSFGYVICCLIHETMSVYVIHVVDKISMLNTSLLLLFIQLDNNCYYCSTKNNLNS